uniref:Nucleoporin NUP35 n=1 Tax=Mesocestoides corti TaxID=53468 RepID=A0A5K3EK65_MESCO
MAASRFGSPVCISSPSAVHNFQSEAMTVGSPPQQSNTPSGSKFLPGFLMGDFHSTPSERFHASSFTKSPPCSPVPQHPRYLQARLSGLKPVPTLDRSSRRHASPPTQGLWSAASQKKLVELGDSQSSVEPMPTKSPKPTSSVYPRFGTPKTASPFENTSSKEGLVENDWSFLPDDESATWITVFGYNPAQASSVLQQFSHFGTIQKYLITNEGNWMHIKYANKIHAKCALNKNGRVFPGNIMIGVRRCTDTEVMRSAAAVAPCNSNPIDVSSHEIFKSPAPKFESLAPTAEPRSKTATAVDSPLQLNHSFSDATKQNSVCPNPGLSRHSSMRPLAAAYQPPPRVQVSRTNQAQSFRVKPSKPAGLFSKALDYVFGWN